MMLSKQKFLKVNRSKSSVSTIYCPICAMDRHASKVYYIPLLNEMGVVTDKFMTVREGSELYKQLVSAGMELPSHMIITKN